VTRQRVSRFVVIGAVGFTVQMAVGAALLAAGLTPVLATLLAIEAAIVTNHVWHRRWAWRDRAHAQAWPATLLRAHVGAGGTSLVVGVGTVAALSGQVPALLAQGIAVALCAAANYWLADRWVFTTAGLGLLVLLPTPVSAAGPSPEALRSWDRYVAALERARTSESTQQVPSWATDDDARGGRVLAALKKGELDVSRRALSGVEVQDATLEHWQGSLLVRGVSIAQITHRLRHPDHFPQPRDVLSLRVANRQESGHDLFLRLTRSLLITATYDTWHQVRHRVTSASRVDSTAVATRIEEIHQPGTPSETRIRLEDSRGFLWRMQSFWRFTAVPDGVIVTCESITLSRPVPLGLGLVSRPIITRVARESMTTAVRAWQAGWAPTRGGQP
jgi:putative flippase GtrA